VSGFSSSIDRLASARSWVRDRPDLESSNSMVLARRKRNRQFFTIDNLHTSVPYTDSSSTWIDLDRLGFKALESEKPNDCPLFN
jgi:hypothetical protein